MATPTNIRVIGFDENRPPMIQPRPCIDLIFELDQEAPPDWCHIFPSIIGKPAYNVEIDPDVGLYIETWVRKPEEIESALAAVKGFVAACNLSYDESQRQKNRVVDSDSPDVVLTPAQVALNEAVARLDFESL